MPIITVNYRNERYSYPLKIDRITIGRASGNHIVIPDEKVSRSHASIFKEGGDFFLEDLNSRNGTYVNGERIKKIKLEHGTVFTIGEAQLTFYREKFREEYLPSPGDVIGGYKIIEKAAQGGMGIVYKAYQISMDRIVALKLLKLKFREDSEWLEQFINEAKIAGRLSHPNIVQIHDFGQEKNFVYFSMEWVEGKDVASIIKNEGRIELPKAINIIKKVADALNYAHSHNVVHHDIKPHNILIREDGEVKLTDMGLATAVGEHTSNSHKIIGTPAYMPPEQAQHKPVTGKADIYSLGATFYHMITGRPPFIGQNPIAVLTKHIKEIPLPPSKYNPIIPSQIDNLIGRMLEKDPEKRPSPHQVIEELEKIGHLPLIRRLEMKRYKKTTTDIQKRRKTLKNKSLKKKSGSEHTLLWIFLILLTCLLGVLYYTKNQRQTSNNTFSIVKKKGSSHRNLPAVSPVNKPFSRKKSYKYFTQEFEQLREKEQELIKDGEFEVLKELYIGLYRKCLNEEEKAKVRERLKFIESQKSQYILGLWKEAQRLRALNKIPEAIKTAKKILEIEEREEVKNFILRLTKYQKETYLSLINQARDITKRFSNFEGFLQILEKKRKILLKTSYLRRIDIIISDLEFLSSVKKRLIWAIQNSPNSKRFICAKKTDLKIFLVAWADKDGILLRYPQKDTPIEIKKRWEKLNVEEIVGLFNIFCTHNIQEVNLLKGILFIERGCIDKGLKIISKIDSSKINISYAKKVKALLAYFKNKIKSFGGSITPEHRRAFSKSKSNNYITYRRVYSINFKIKEGRATIKNNFIKCLNSGKVKIFSIKNIYAASNTKLVFFIKFYDENYNVRIGIGVPKQNYISICFKKKRLEWRSYFRTDFMRREFSPHIPVDRWIKVELICESKNFISLYLDNFRIFRVYQLGALFIKGYIFIESVNSKYEIKNVKFFRR